MLSACELKLQSAAELFRRGLTKKSFLELVQISNELSKDLRYLYLLSEIQSDLQDQTGYLTTLKTIAKISDCVGDYLAHMNALVVAGRLNEALDVSIALSRFELHGHEVIRKNRLLVKIYSQENDFEGLAEACDELFAQAYVGADYYYAKGLLAMQKDDQEMAVEYLRQAVQADSKFDQGWAALGLLHDQRGDRELAKANLEKALDVNPYNAVALKCLMKWSSDKADLKKASLRLNFYLQKHNFDEDMTTHHVEILKKNGQNDFAQSEVVKLCYYFGKPLAV